MGQMLGLDKAFGDPIDPKKWAANMPLGIVADHDAAYFASMQIYFDVGTDDRYHFNAPNQELDREMTAKHIEHTFRLVEGGGHSWGSASMRDNMSHSLEFVAHAFAAADQPKAEEPPATPEHAEPVEVK